MRAAYGIEAAPTVTWSRIALSRRSIANALRRRVGKRKEGDGMARASLGNKALSVLVAATMVVSLNAPVSAWAGDGDASAESGAAAEQPQAENTLGGVLRI